jgi:hypothetical protein
MRELTLTCARTRRIRGVSTPQSASQFLSELGNQQVQVEDRSSPPAPPGRTRGGQRAGGFYNDVAERADIEAALDEAEGPHLSGGEEGVPPPPAEYEHLVVNCRIRHPKFGQGKVIALRNQWPETRAEIIFDNCGHKTIWLKHTHLEVMDDWG